MVKLCGIGVSEGIAIGKLHFLQLVKQVVTEQKTDDYKKEIIRFNEAKEKSLVELENIYHKAVSEVGETEAEIFRIHKMMLDDDDYNESITHMIEAQQVNAEFAVSRTSENFSQMFLNMTDNAYMQARAADVQDISDRVIRILAGVEENKNQLREPAILASEDLTPSQTLQMDKEMALGFLTVSGSKNSHSAILARTMALPAVINLEGLLKPEHNHAEVIVDGFSGEVYIHPNQEMLQLYKSKQAKLTAQHKLLEEMKGKESITKSGQKIRLYANIGGPSDLYSVLQNDAEGIGLFRSEFIYLESSDYPTEQEQFEIYKQVAENMAGREVIIRTLDIGADKHAPYFELKPEENPALGLRGIRICLTNHGVFLTQLKAILRASAYGKLAIMFPMIISIEEVRQAKILVELAKEELSALGILFDKNVKIGIMIETPAAALISADLAKEVDFFSIGTNDLTQYTLALDRQNVGLDRFYNPYHPAVLNLIRLVATNAHENGIWVGICGELGADTSLTSTFIEMGIDELSVSPTAILKLRKQIREME